MVAAQASHTSSGAGPSDAALVVAARAGEPWAQEALFHRYARMVNGMAYRIMGRDADVDDLVQDAFLEAFRSLDRLKEPAAFGSWLGSIVVRTASKRLRRRSLMSRLGLRRNTPIELDAVIGQDAPPDVQAQLSAVYGVLDGLSVQARTALVLHRVEGRALPEVARLMGVSLSTAKRRLGDADEAVRVFRQEGRDD